MIGAIQPQDLCAVPLAGLLLDTDGGAMCVCVCVGEGDIVIIHECMHGHGVQHYRGNAGQRNRTMVKIQYVVTDFYPQCTTHRCVNALL